MIWPFKKRKFDIEFIDTTQKVFTRFPVQRAIDVLPNCYSDQKEKYGKVRFPRCPGMIDYARMGYIIPAWTDINILANKGGVSYSIGSKTRGPNFSAPRAMDPSVIDGVFDVEDDVPLTPIHFGAPWSIFTAKGVSALVLPATYHAKFLDDLVVLPGVVDYEDFHAINLICMPRRACKVKIKVGEPLLHVIPIRTEDIKGGYGPASVEHKGECANEVYGDDPQFYRKFYQRTKRFLLGPTSEDTNTEV